MIRSPLKAAHPGVLVLFLLSPALGAQQPRQVPSQVARELGQRQPVVTVDVKPTPATVNKPVDLRAIVTPEVTGVLVYEFYIDSAKLTQCASDSPACRWTPAAPAKYLARVVVHRQRLGRERLGSPDSEITGRFLFEVQEANQIPPATGKAPDDKPPVTSGVAPPIAFTLRAIPSQIDAGGSVTLVVSRVDGRPLTAYTLDRGDGLPTTESSSSLVVTYQRSGRYVVSVAPIAGVAGTPATAVIIVRSGFPPPWLYVVLAIGGVAVVAIVGALAVRSTTRRRLLLPSATFYPRPDVTPRFAPSRTHGIALEIHYVPHLASLRYTPRVRIGQEE